MRFSKPSRLSGTLLSALALVICAVPALGAQDDWALTTGTGGTDYVLVIDCTGTMRFEGKGEATEQAVEAFLDALCPGDCVTVYGYGEGAFAALAEYPVVLESEATKERAKQMLSLPFDDDRTDITSGLELAWNERSWIFPNTSEGSPRTPGTSCVILLTDGKLIPNYDDYAQYDSIYSASRSRLLELGDLFGQHGIPVYTVGLGAADKVDGDLMAAVSRRSGGRYYHAASSGDLSVVFGTLADNVVRPRELVEPVAAPGETEPVQTAAPEVTESVNVAAATVDAGVTGSRTRHVAVEGDGAETRESGNRGLAAANTA
ncbi:MAG: hypothetical protein ABIG03_01490, partial [Candidatus Eisenbacteria bacterium]